MKNSWSWLVPEIYSDELFSIYISTSDGRYFGKSEPFPILPGAIKIVKKPGTIQKELIKLGDKGEFHRKDYPPPNAKALDVSFSIKSSKPFFNSDGVLYKMVLYVNIYNSQSFVFGDPKGAKASWLTLKPNAVVDVNLITGQKCIITDFVFSQLWRGKNSFNTEFGDLVLDYPKNVIKKGKSTAMFTLKLKPYNYGPIVEIWTGKKIIKTGAKKMVSNLKAFPTYQVQMEFKAWDPDLSQLVNYRWVLKDGKYIGFAGKLDTGKKEIKTGVPVKKNIVFSPDCTW